jgi:uncharacterized membrane protein YhaH (DUF805 family)
MFKTLFGFHGRLSRAGFAEALLALVLVNVAAVVAWKFISANGLPGLTAAGDLSEAIGLAVFVLTALLTLWALLAVSAKRAHDRGRSAWWLLLGVVPVLGQLWWLIDLGVLAGSKGDNKYGAEPHGAADEHFGPTPAEAVAYAAPAETVQAAPVLEEQSHEPAAPAPYRFDDQAEAPADAPAEAEAEHPHDGGHHEQEAPAEVVELSAEGQAEAHEADHGHEPAAEPERGPSEEELAHEPELAAEHAHAHEPEPAQAHV